MQTIKVTGNDGDTVTISVHLQPKNLSTAYMKIDSEWEPISNDGSFSRQCPCSVELRLRFDYEPWSYFVSAIRSNGSKGEVFGDSGNEGNVITDETAEVYVTIDAT